MDEIKEITHLIGLLENAKVMVGKYSEGYSDHFLSAEEFCVGLEKQINRLKNNELESIEYLYLWFAPTYDWDDFVGDEGTELGNQIFSVLSKFI